MAKPAKQTIRGNTTINYKASPTAMQFHKSAAFIRALIGCVGGGKTVALSMEILRLGMEQQADYDELVYPRINGMAVRPTRWLMVRATYPQLKQTLIKTWNEWTGKLGTIVYDSPIRFNALFPMGDGTVMDLEVVFMALDGPRAAENLRSLEVTGIGFSEFAEIGADIFEMAQTRVGRYPKKVEDEEGNVLFGPTRPCIVMESNSPSTRSHWYRLFEIDRPPNIAVFKQPPAMLYNYADESYYPNPEAENIRNLPGGYQYYENIIAGASPEFISVYVMNNYGSTFAGKPVYPAFQSRRHVLGDSGQITAAEADKMFVPERKQLILGLDLGLNPGGALCQENSLGGITCYEELVAEDIRFEEFINDMLIPVLSQRYQGLPVLIIYDPSNPRSSLSNQTAAQMLKERGFAAMPAPTNDPAFRVESVNYYLQRERMFALHPRCTTIREGMAGGYHFEAVQGRSGVYKEVPCKNEYSHVMNGLEYATSYFYYGMRRAMQKSRRNAVLGSTGSKPKGFTYV